MMIFKKAIPRRLFLQGVGTTLALPLLDSMVPAFAKPAESRTPVSRLAVCYGPNGRIMKNWTPPAEGPLSADISPTLAPLAAVRDQVLVLTGLDIKIADPLGNESGGVHARPAAGFLTGLHAKPGDSVGISLDQYVAKHYGAETQLGSIEMSLDSSQFAPDDGAYSSYYMHAISWRTGTAPLPMEHNPRVIFERLFGDSDTTDPAERLRRAQDRKSILDSVTQGVANLLGGVGPGDRVKLDEYLEAIRDIERRIQVAEKLSDATAEPSTTMDRPVGIPSSFTDYARLMFDLQVVAFQADLTRSITFMFGREQTDRNFPEIGIGDGHHPLSHHKGVAEQIALVEQIDRHHVEQVAYFLEKMKSTPDGDGSLLDHTVVILGSGLSDANFHIHYNVPVVLAGQVKGGRHLRYEGTPLTNMLLAVLDIMKIPAEGFLESKQTDATGKLEHLSLV